MKTNFNLLIAAALPLAALCACQGGNKGGESGAIELKEIAFQASAPVTKATVEGSEFSWEEGDVFYIGSDLEEGSVNGETVKGLAKVVISAADISEDGKTATVLAKVPAKASRYYAYAMGQDANLLKSVTKAGEATFAAVDEAGASVKLAAYAGCLASAKKLAFATMLTPVYFKVEGSYAKVTLEGANGEVVTDEFKVTAVGASSLCGTDEKKIVTMNLDGTETEAFFHLAPGITLNGFVLKMYDASGAQVATVESEEVITTATRSQSRPTTAIAEPVSVLDYYAEWEKGRDITINGNVYNKATSGLNAVKVDAGQALSGNVENTILFIEPDAENTPVTYDGAGATFSGKVIVVGNKSDRRSYLTVVNKAPRFEASVSLFNISFTFTSVQNETNAPAMLSIEGTGKKRNLYIDRCEIRIPAGCEILHGTTGGVENIFIENSYWPILGAQSSIAMLHKNTQEWGRVKLHNNVIYTPDGGAEDWWVLRNEGSANSPDGLNTFHSIILTNNMIFNIKPHSDGDPSKLGMFPEHLGVFQPGSVTDSLVMLRNVMYFDAPDWHSAHFVILRTFNGAVPTYFCQNDVPLAAGEEENPDYPNNVLWGKSNLFYRSPDTANGTAFIDNGDEETTFKLLTSWFSNVGVQWVWVNLMESSPLSQFDIAGPNGPTWTMKKAYRAYGAQL